MSLERAERPAIIAEEDWSELISATGDMSYGDREALRHLVVKIALAAFESHEHVHHETIEHEYNGDQLTPAQETALLAAYEKAKENPSEPFAIYNGQWGTRPDVVERLVATGLLRSHVLRYNLHQKEARHEFTPAGAQEVKRIAAKRAARKGVTR